MSSVSIGRVTHYFARSGAAVIALESGTLARGDRIHVHGHSTDVIERVESLRLDDRDVGEAAAPATVGISIGNAVRAGDRVDRLVDEPAN